MPRPSRPHGTNAKAHFWQWAYDELVSLAPAQTIGGLIGIAPSGATHTPNISRRVITHRAAAAGDNGGGTGDNGIEGFIIQYNWAAGTSTITRTRYEGLFPQINSITTASGTFTFNHAAQNPARGTWRIVSTPQFGPPVASLPIVGVVFNGVNSLMQAGQRDFHVDSGGPIYVGVFINPGAPVNTTGSDLIIQVIGSRISSSFIN